MKGISRRHFLQFAGTTAAGLLLGSCAATKTPAVERNPLSTPAENAFPTATQAASLIPDQAGGQAPTATPLAQNVPTQSPTPANTQADSRSTATPKAPISQGGTYLAVARGTEPTKMVQAALSALGGIERFVKNGQNVIIKPNICTDYHTPEYATTTNPDVVAALVRLCLGAGAKKVQVMDNPFGGTADSAYAKSGIRAAVQAAGGEMVIMSPIKYKDTPIPNAKSIQSVTIYKDILDVDVFIDVPIAKHHSLAGLTLGGKNLLGVTGEAGSFHSNMGERVADLVSLVKPDLTLIDAVRILVDHGPTGGSLDDVKRTNTIIASHDIICADAYAATLFGKTGQDVSYVKAGAARGLGTLDLSSVKIEEISV